MYEFEDFRDPIDSVCQTALDRLQNLCDEDYDAIEESDIVTERIIANEADEFGGSRLNTQLKLFTSAFCVHEDLLEAEEPPEYFNDIIAGLVRNGIRQREEWAGNEATQLIPDNEALKEHVLKIWQLHKLERYSRSEFTVYRFHYGIHMAAIKFVHDSENNQWKIGYNVNINRVILRWGANLYEETNGTLLADPINGDSKQISTE